MLNAIAPLKIIFTAPFLRYGFQLGAPPTPGDKLLPNIRLILGNLNVLNVSPPFEKISTVPFLRYGFRLGAPPTPGDELLSNKRLILGNVKVLNASQALTVFMILTLRHVGG